MRTLTTQRRFSPAYYAQRFLAITLIALIFAGLNMRADSVTEGTDSGKVADQSIQVPDYRFMVETKETATFYVGQQGKFNIVLLDRYGKRVDAPTDLETTITVTTLETLDEARSWLDSKKDLPLPQKASPTRSVTLARGQEASRTKIIYRKGEEDETVLLLSNQPGALHIFVESQNIATGETSVVVLGARRQRAEVTQFPGQLAPEVRIMPATFQEGPATPGVPAASLSRPPRLKLDLHPLKPFFYNNQGDQMGRFKVVLQSADGQFEEASRDITVILQIVEGYAHFAPDLLTIPKGQVISPEPAELRTRPGGSITVSASTSKPNITGATRTYDFPPGVHSKSLSVQKQRESAYANGLDEIELRVTALQGTRAITPEEEGMDDRKISFHLMGDSQGVRFENGQSEISIPKGQTSGTIKLFSVRSVSDLKVVAQSWNGLRDQIKSAEDIRLRFSFPWLPMLFSLIGGLIFPLLGNRYPRSLAQGVVIGGICFGLALFGAIVSDPYRVGYVAVNLTKLPTENVLASLILGFLGNVLFGAVFAQVRRLNSLRPAKP